MGDSSTAPPATAALQGRRIQVRQGTPADVGAIVDIHYAAFKAGPMSRLLSPGGVTEDAKAKFGKRIFPPQEEGKKEGGDEGEPLVFVAELVGDDGAQPELVAFSKWTLFRRERSREEWDVETPPMTVEMLGEGSDPEVFNAFIGAMNEYKKKAIQGQRHLHLGILACSPKYHRIGAGGALLRRGLELADAEGLPTFLESSPEGYKLYKRHGFEDLWAFDLELTQRWGVTPQPGVNWGHGNAVEHCGPCPEGAYRTVGMKRPPKSS
ncbi:uncharacterized protein PpBr36_06440 [Pyricularia pennisetigena]|uniref:uncharacterized protein n=1 Tax=Pyricularia pennisetigena TaxID=1578925 RepID=UPI00114DA5FF|nr:uncharacterized protein PpBr36_06440 [Pyricularia pennisetigena]TLS22846.1 hypothetical protein PpBr36_06440 [Pyricularia pennisetigena]